MVNQVAVTYFKTLFVVVLSVVDREELVEPIGKIVKLLGHMT